MLHRKLTNRERSILNALRELPIGSEFIANIIDRSIGGVRIRVSKEEDSAWIRLEEESFHRETDQRLAYDLVIQVLKNSFWVTDELFGLGVISSQDLKTDDPLQFGPGITNAPSVDMPITDHTIVDQLIEWSAARVFIDEDKLRAQPES